MEQLQDVRIQILDAADAVIATSPILNPANNMPGETVPSNPFLLGWDFTRTNGGLPITGRKVHVQIDDAVTIEVPLEQRDAAVRICAAKRTDAQGQGRIALDAGRADYCERRLVLRLGIAAAAATGVQQ